MEEGILPHLVAANELGGKRMVVEAHFPQRRLILQGYHGDHSSGDEKMGKGRGGVTTQGLPSSPVWGLNVSRPAHPRNF